MNTDQIKLAQIEIAFYDYEHQAEAVKSSWVSVMLLFWLGVYASIQVVFSGNHYSWWAWLLGSVWLALCLYANAMDAKKKKLAGDKLLDLLHSVQQNI